MSTLPTFLRGLFFILLLSLTQTACLSGQDAGVDGRGYGLMLKTLLSHTVPEVDVATAAAAPPSTVFLDAREDAEFAVSRIAGARAVGYDDFSLSAVSDLPKDTPIIVYCSVGYRSEKVSERLITAGYTDVANLYGGIFEWKNAGQTVVDADGNPTEAVHAYNRTWGVWLKKGEKVYE